MKAFWFKGPGLKVGSLTWRVQLSYNTLGALAFSALRRSFAVRGSFHLQLTAAGNGGLLPGLAVLIHGP